jgi:hypothetical protein
MGRHYERKEKSLFCEGPLNIRLRAIPRKLSKDRLEGAKSTSLSL